MSFSRLCPNGSPGENGAHDITDSMTNDAAMVQVLFCRRCGQAVRVSEALIRTNDIDRPASKFVPSVPDGMKEPQ